MLLTIGLLSVVVYWWVTFYSHYLNHPDEWRVDAHSEYLRERWQAQVAALDVDTTHSEPYGELYVAHPTALLVWGPGYSKLRPSQEEGEV